MKTTSFFVTIAGALLLATIPALAKPAKRPATSIQRSSLPAANLGGARVFIKYSLQYYPSATTRFDTSGAVSRWHRFR